MEKRNITIKMPINRDEDFEGKPNRSLKRGRDINSKEDRQKEGKDRDEEDEKQGTEEKNEQEFEEFGSSQYTCMISGKDKNVVWRNFDNISARMRLNREMIKTLVKDNKEGKN